MTHDPIYRGPVYRSVAEHAAHSRMRWARLDAALTRFFQQYNSDRKVK